MRGMLALLTVSLTVLAGAPSFAADRMFNANLISYQEAPPISSTATGTFESQLSKDETTLTYQLEYTGLQGDVRQAHIHFGQKNVSGGISVFLCQTSFNTDPTGIKLIMERLSKSMRAYQLGDRRYALKLRN